MDTRLTPEEIERRSTVEGTVTADQLSEATLPEGMGAAPSMATSPESMATSPESMAAPSMPIAQAAKAFPAPPMSMMGLPQGLPAGLEGATKSPIGVVSVVRAPWTERLAQIQQGQDPSVAASQQLATLPSSPAVPATQMGPEPPAVSTPTGLVSSGAQAISPAGAPERIIEGTYRSLEEEELPAPEVQAFLEDPGPSEPEVPPPPPPSEPRYEPRVEPVEEIALEAPATSEGSLSMADVGYREATKAAAARLGMGGANTMTVTSMPVKRSTLKRMKRRRFSRASFKRM